ncbi:MAG: ABC transporter ATP-binding protein, partial [Candidatus Electrothrix sp.]
FEHPTSGAIMLRGQDISHLPPNQRSVNTVFQNYALFPHMTVAQNVAYGLMIKKVPRPERKERVAEALALVQMNGMEHRKPAELSGGQQQRAALARALVNRPAVLLLDEPLGALDLKLRKQMQYELKQLQTRLGITFIYVTHDQEEALTMSDRIAIMNAGQVLQVDSPAVIYEQPATRFVADFIGETNFLRSRVLEAGNGTITVEIAGERIVLLMDGAWTAGDEVLLAIRPERLELGLHNELPAVMMEQNHPSALNGVIESSMFIGTDIRCLIRLWNNESLVVRLQNTRQYPLTAYTTGEQVKVWYYADDMRLLSE